MFMRIRFTGEISSTLFLKKICLDVFLVVTVESSLDKSMRTKGKKRFVNHLCDLP